MSYPSALLSLRFFSFCTRDGYQTWAISSKYSADLLSLNFAYQATLYTCLLIKPISMLDMCLKRFLKEITLLIRTYQAGCCITKKKNNGKCYTY